MSEQILCVSYFDQVIGPNLFYCSEENLEGPEYPDLGRILEFNESEGSFIFAFRKYQTLNHIFFIDSNVARGRKEILMITYMIKSAYFKNEIADVFKFLQSRTQNLESMVNDLKDLKDLPSILHSHKTLQSDSDVLSNKWGDFKNKFLEIFNKHFKGLSPTEFPFKPKSNTKKIFIIGTHRSGKTRFLKSIEEIQFHNQENDDLPTRIFEVVIDNLTILGHDCIKRDFACEECKNYGNCSNAQGFILMINLDDPLSVIDAKSMFDNIVNRCSDYDNQVTPILVIGNKFHKEDKVSFEFIEKEFNLNKLEECRMKMKYYSINVLKEEEKIMKGLRWLVRHLI